MNKLCLLVLAAVLMASVATNVEAATAPPVAVAKPPPGGGATTPTGGGQTYDAGQPFHPEGVCVHGLGYLPDLTVADIAAINDGNRVKVVPVCTGFSQATPHDMEKNGNVDGFIGAIDRNPAIRGPLFFKGYRPAEVVAIVPADDGSATVYVHH